MTLTDLEKLEALHAAVLQCDEEPIEAWFKADVAYRSALHNAFPTMAKALREALSAADEAARERSDWMHSLDRAKADITTLMRARDESRAEVERLCALLGRKDPVECSSCGDIR